MCPGFGWHRVLFFSSSCHSDTFWIYDENHVDNTKRTQPHQLTQTCKRNIPYYTSSCPINELRGANWERLTAVQGLAGHQSACGDNCIAHHLSFLGFISLSFVIFLFITAITFYYILFSFIY